MIPDFIIDLRPSCCKMNWPFSPEVGRRRSRRFGPSLLLVRYPTRIALPKDVLPAHSTLETYRSWLVTARRPTRVSRWRWIRRRQCLDETQMQAQPPSMCGRSSAVQQGSLPNFCIQQRFLDQPLSLTRDEMDSETGLSLNQAAHGSDFGEHTACHVDPVGAGQ